MADRMDNPWGNGTEPPFGIDWYKLSRPDLLLKIRTGASIDELYRARGFALEKTPPDLEIADLAEGMIATYVSSLQANSRAGDPNEIARLAREALEARDEMRVMNARQFVEFVRGNQNEPLVPDPLL